MKKQFTTIAATAVITTIIIGGATYLWQQASHPTPTTPAQVSNTLATQKTENENNGQAVRNEIQNLLATKFGMRLSYREPIYSHEPAKSADGTLIATINSYHTNRFIEVADKKNNSLHQYVNTDDYSLVEELGDLHFSSDGKKLAYAVYFFNSANNDEVIIGGMSYVYIIDLETGKQIMFNLTKKEKTILRVIDWKEKDPTIIEELLNEKNTPGTYPSLFIPYVLK